MLPYCVVPPMPGADVGSARPAGIAACDHCGFVFVRARRGEGTCRRCGDADHVVPFQAAT